MKTYDPSNWFWTVGGDKGRFWSSAARAYVDTLPEDEGFTNIASEAELWDVLREQAPDGLPIYPPSSKEVNAERDRREIAGCTVTVSGAGAIPLEGNEKSMRNLQGLAFAASLRLGQGDTTTVTVFRDAVNVDHSLVPGQIVSLWSQGAAYISALYGASWVIKALDPIPADFADDARWPAYV